MGKKFMGYGNASELITAIGTKIKAKYTKPDTGIPKSDLATAVQTSLEELVDNGAKNIFDANTTAIGSNNGGNISISGNAITVTGGSPWAKGYIRFIVEPDKDYTIRFTVTSNDSSNVYIMIGQSQTSAIYSKTLSDGQTGSFEGTFHSPANTTKLNLYISVNNTSVSVSPDKTIVLTDVMVTTKAKYDISPTYEPHALGNQYLTPSLVEVVDSGAKNKLKLDKDAIKSLNSGGTWSRYVYTPTTAPNLTVTINDDSTVTLNGSTSSSLVTVALERKASSGFQGYVLSGSKANTKLVYQLAVSPYTVYATADGVGSSVIANYTDGSTIQLSLQIVANSTFSNTVITPMICTEADWNVSQKYVPPALPNYDLTVREAEDRAALVEQVDASAKNEFILGDSVVSSGGTTATISGNAVTVAGATSWSKAWRTFRVKKNTTYVLSFRVTNVATVANPNYRVSLGNNHHSGGSYYGIIECNTTGNYYMEFTPPTDADIYLVINPNYTPTAASDMPSITVDNIMVCTEAAFRVSPTYAPYRKSLDRLEAEDRAALTEVVDSGAKNKLDLSKATITVGSGLTLTRDGDAYVVNGTLSAQSQIVFMNFPPVAGDNLILSGCPSNGSTAGYGIWAYNGSTRVIIDDGSDIKTPYSGEITQIKFNFAAGNYSNVKFYPMICTLADWKISPKFVPYRPNWDLVSTLFPTSYVAPAVNSSVSSKLSIICGGYAKMGKLVNINMRLVVTDTIPVGNQLFYGLPTINIDAGSLSVGAAVGGCYFQHISTGDTGTDTTGAITYEGTTALSALVLPFASEPLKAGTYIVTGTYLSA